MGKGDRKTRRGKIYAGSFGKLRPKDPNKAEKKPVARAPTRPAPARAAAKTPAKRAKSS